MKLDDVKADRKMLDESSLDFNNKMDIAVNKSFEGTLCEPFFKDSAMCNSHDSFPMLHENTKFQVNRNSTDSDTSSADYEIVSLNVKKTTVINATYNIFTQSTIQNVEKNEFVQTVPSTPHKLNEPIDESRVVVQVLTSNSQNCVKTETVIENRNNRGQNSNVRSFREDVFKMLSKNKPKNGIDKGSDSDEHKINSNSHETLKFLSHITPIKCNIDRNYLKKCIQIEEKNNLCQATNFRNFSDDNKKSFEVEEDSINSEKSDIEVTANCDISNQIQSTDRKKNLKFFFLNGKGAKLGEIEYVALNLKNASIRLLRILHYILFGTYGLCSTGFQLSRTKKNIYLFCGYPFQRDSEFFSKKRNCLLRLPFPILLDIHKSFIQEVSSNRSEIVSQLMDFFMKPQDQNEERIEDSEMINPCQDYSQLRAIKRMMLMPEVKLRRLSKEDIEKLQNQIKSESGLKENQKGSANKCSSYFIPAYILKGPGTKLKHFPKIVKRVCSAENQIIEILHYVLYGRMESEEVLRRNILEFSGFLPCQKKFITDREAMLQNMKPMELRQICNILCLHAKTNSPGRKVKKILAYMSAPSDPADFKHKGALRRQEKRERKLPPLIKYEKPCLSEKKNTAVGPKLRDFKLICSNIQCASPFDLKELSDLLFIRPCDGAEIHEKILDFTKFEFLFESVEYYYRKTLMHYMSFNIIRKIARLLDIENRDNISRQEDLSSSILNFLMEMKLQDSSHRRIGVCKPMQSVKVVEKCKSLEEHKQHLVEIIHQRTRESLCHKNSPIPVQNNESSLDHPYSFHKNSSKQVIKMLASSTVIHGISRSPPEPMAGTEIEESSPDVDDSIPLRVLLHHPTDEDLQRIVTSIIKSGLWTLSLQDLVQKVYEYYPRCDITYRETFIKNVAKQVLSQLKNNAIAKINSMQLQMRNGI